MKTPLYQGETPAVSRVPQVQLPTSHPMQEVWDKNQARATQNAYAIEDAIVDRLEYTREQELEAESKQLNADLKAGLDHALSLANGAPGSLFKADGTPNAAAIKSFANPYTARLTNWNKGFITPQSQQQAALAKQIARTGIKETIRATVSESLKPRALAAFKQNYELSLAQGDSEGAINAAKELHARGYASDSELALYTLDAQEKGIDYKLDHIQNFDQAQALYNNPDFTKNLNSRQQRQLENTLDYYAAQSIPPAAILKAGRKAGSTNPQDYEKTAPLPPAGLPFYMQNIWANNSGDFSTKNPNGRQMASVAAFRWAMDTIPVDTPESPEWEAMFRTQAAAFGVSEQTATAAINEARNALTAKTAPALTKAIEAIPQTSLIPWLSSADMDKVAAETKGIDKWKDLPTDDLKANAARRWYYYNHLKMRVSKEAADLFEASPDISPAAFQTALAQSQRDKIATEYTSWLANGKNSKASYEMKLQQLNHIINKHVMTMGHKEKIDASMEPYLNMARQADAEQKIRYTNIRNRQLQTRQQTEEYKKNMQNQVDTPVQYSTLNYTGDNITALPYSTSAPVIYVPKGFTALGKAGDDAAVIDPSSGKAISVRLMEVDGIEAPTISTVLSRQFRLYKHKGAPISITKSNGRIFITTDPVKTDAPQGNIAPDNYLFPDDGLVPVDEYEYTEEHSMPMSDLPIA